MATLLHTTNKLHKLVEHTARVCYQSYEKTNETSHSFVKGPLKAGHLSITSVGNIVVRLDAPSAMIQQNNGMLLDFMTLHEITQFVKWTKPDKKKNPNGKYFIISMNMLTFMDIWKERDEYEWHSSLLQEIYVAVNTNPEAAWFHDHKVPLPEEENMYTAMGTPKLYEPIILDQDVTTLKALGLTPYELVVHATITTNVLTDRSASLQFWRHWSGGCELSQRYVDRQNAEFRDMVGVEEMIQKGIEKTGNEAAANLLRETLVGAKECVLEDYEDIFDACVMLGFNKARAREVARSVLPNNIVTQLIQSRPLRNWLHLFEQRDTAHAQREIREDVMAIKRALRELGVPVTQEELNAL